MIERTLTVLNGINKKSCTCGCILVKLPKDKRDILRDSREQKSVSYKEVRIRLASDFSVATMDLGDNGVISSKY